MEASHMAADNHMMGSDIQSVRKPNMLGQAWLEKRQKKRKTKEATCLWLCKRLCLGPGILGK